MSIQAAVNQAITGVGAIKALEKMTPEYAQKIKTQQEIKNVTELKDLTKQNIIEGEYDAAMSQEEELHTLATESLNPEVRKIAGRYKPGESSHIDMLSDIFPDKADKFTELGNVEKLFGGYGKITDLEIGKKVKVNEYLLYKEKAKLRAEDMTKSVVDTRASTKKKRSSLKEGK